MGVQSPQPSSVSPGQNYVSFLPCFSPWRYQGLQHNGRGLGGVQGLVRVFREVGTLELIPYQFFSGGALFTRGTVVLCFSRGTNIWSKAAVSTEPSRRPVVPSSRPLQHATKKVPSFPRVYECSTQEGMAQLLVISLAKRVDAPIDREPITTTLLPQK